MSRTENKKWGSRALSVHGKLASSLNALRSYCSHKRTAFIADQDGAIAVMFALTLPLVVGFVGLGVETAFWYSTKARATATASVAAHAAAKEAEKSPDDDTLLNAIALETASLFGVEQQELALAAVETDEGVRVDVRVQLTAPRYFSYLYSDEDVITVGGASSALVESAGEACLVALDPDGEGVDFGGNTDVRLNGCLVMSNSTEASGALTVNGSARLASACAASVGGANIPQGHATFTDCKKERTGAKPVIDPYAGLTLPDLTSAPYNSCSSLPSASGGGKSKGKKSAPSVAPKIQSGRYCGGLRFSGVMEIEDGATLIIDGGDFENQGPAYIGGDNVTIILMNDARIQLTSQATVDLASKSSGEYAGLIFIGDAATQDVTHRWNGGSLNRLLGAFYLPTDGLELRGGANATAGCLHMIAAEIDARGNSRFSNDCAGVGTRPLVVSGGVRLVDSVI